MAWKSISRGKFLYLRGRSFYVRRRVPVDLREEIGKEFLIRSLNTSDFKEASRLASFVNAEHQRLLDQASGRRVSSSDVRNLDNLSGDEIEKIVTNWFSSSYVAQANYVGGDELYELDEYELAEEAAEQHEGRIRSVKNIQILSLPDHPMQEPLLRRTMQLIAERNGLETRRVKKDVLSNITEIASDKKGWKYRFFFDLVRRATVELRRQEVDYAALLPTYIRDEELKEAMHSPRSKGKRTVTLAELIEEFKSDPSRKAMRKKVELDYSLLFRVMDEVIGYDRRLKDIERDDCKRVRDLLLRLPTNCTKIYPTLTFERAAEHGQKDGRKLLSPTTVNSYVHKMSALFNYGLVEERIDKNPAKKLGIDGHDHSDEDRNPFDLDQLARIFAAPIYTGCEDDKRNWANKGVAKPKGTKFWVPLIGLYQGMRLNEICQLRLEDVKKEEDIFYFDIKPDQLSADTLNAADVGGKRVKTASSRRRIPIHPSLTELGFMSFVESQREIGERRLFPDLKKDGRGYYSDGFQKWFSRFLIKVGAKKPKSSFHSFRHNWADAMRLAEVPRERRLLIGGWKKTSTEEMYGSDFPLRTIYNELCKVKYDKVKALNDLFC